MSNKTFEGTTLDECLNKASELLRLKKEEIKYKIIKEKKGLFNKYASIEVINKLEDSTEDRNGTVSIKDGIINVKNPKDGGRFAAIIPSKGIKLLVDDKECSSRVEVKEESKIEIIFNEETPIRELKVNISPDKMKAFVSIAYIPKKVYKLQDAPEANTVVLKYNIADKVFPPSYTSKELEENLKQYLVIHGIIKENFDRCIKGEEVSNFLIAEGEPAINDENDRIDIKFITGNKKEYKQDKTGKVDYKSIGYINSVKVGEILAEKILGKQGKDGVDITGKVIKKKSGKRVNLIAGAGTELKDENTIVAAIEGKPCAKGNTICVYQVHEVNEDVDLKTGNVKFVGDIIVHGGVTEGMKIEAGNSVEVNKNVERAVITSKGDILIKGNIISSNIYAGGEDVITIRLIKDLHELDDNLKSLLDTIVDIKKFNLLGKNTPDGEIVKVLIENKYKSISKLSISISKNLLLVGSESDKLFKVLKNKLIGIAPLNIKDYNELNEVLEEINIRLENLKESLSVPVNINIQYCQDSRINSTGDIIISGRGEYISFINANKGIYFTGNKSVTRGGIIKAKNEIKCKTVGSSGGVLTKLVVEEKGHIWADIAYQNTKFIIGSREYNLDLPSKNVHAYIDNTGELIVDKFIL